jgi:hypothetical protein
MRATSHRKSSGSLRASALVLCWLASGTPTAQQAAAAQSTEPSLESMSLPALKERYRACDALIAYELPTPAEFEQCSVTYETLKKRGFGGSTERFAQWLRQQPAPLRPAPR